MSMSVMNIRVMPMGVNQRRVTVPMGMGLATGIIGAMIVLMMNIVDVPMLMLDGGVLMHVLVDFGQMEVKANRHQTARANQARCYRFPE
jgi:hypothetical protein